MKSRWTTYLSLVAVVAVWGIVAWRIFSRSEEPSTTPAPRKSTPVQPQPDTLWLDYPDPFLKGGAPRPATPSRIVRALPPAEVKARRERVRLTHQGTVSVGRRRLYIVTIGSAQYELYPGDEVEGFVCAQSDTDSLYLHKEGAIYGVKLCD